VTVQISCTVDLVEKLENLPAETRYQLYGFVSKVKIFRLEEEKEKDGLILFPVWGVIIGDRSDI
jgi:hypothetical protein